LGVYPLIPSGGLGDAFMELNKTYIIRVLINNNLLTYSGKILSEDDFFIEFLDRYGKKVSVNKNTIQSFEEDGNE